MADDYGALATVENLGRDGKAHVIRIHLPTEGQEPAQAIEAAEEV